MKNDTVVPFIIYVRTQVYVRCVAESGVLRLLRNDTKGSVRLLLYIIDILLIVFDIHKHK